MKNIHMLPTENSSRLYLYKSIELFLHPTIVDANVSNLHCQNQNIYITSDEEIKEGGYVFWEGKIYAYREFMKMRTPVYTDYFPTILTTDQDLIKNGVQAIDNEFLEWFVKNPSCESVEVKCYSKFNDGDFSDYKIFEEKLKHINKIIIPKEEPKQETLEEAAEKYVEDFDLSFYDTVDQIPIKEFATKDFIEGAKWMQEKSYSEEDLEVAYFEGREGLYSFNDCLEEFKKK